MFRDYLMYKTLFEIYTDIHNENDRIMSYVSRLFIKIKEAPWSKRILAEKFFLLEYAHPQGRRRMPPEGGCGGNTGI